MWAREYTFVALVRTYFFFFTSKKKKDKSISISFCKLLFTLLIDPKSLGFRIISGAGSLLYNNSSHSGSMSRSRSRGVSGANPASSTSLVDVTSSEDWVLTFHVPNKKFFVSRKGRATLSFMASEVLAPVKDIAEPTCIHIYFNNGSLPLECFCQSIWERDELYEVTIY